MSRYRLKIPKEIENTVIGTYKKIENTVVGGYKRIENGVVGGYKAVEQRFVDTFLERVDDAPEKAASSQAIAEEQKEESL